MYSPFAQQYLKKAFTRVFCMLKVVGRLSIRVFCMVNVVENAFHSGVWHIQDG